MAWILHPKDTGHTMHLIEHLLGRAGPIVGLDIGASAVKVAEVTPRGGRDAVAVGWAPTPSGSFTEGAIADPGGVAQAVRQAFRSAGIRGRQVATALPGSAVSVKRLTLPPMPAAAIPEAVAHDAARHVPFDIGDVNLDYHRIENGATGPEDPIEIILVAAKRETVARYVGVLAQADCAPRVIDVGAFALQNAFEWTDAAAARAGFVALIDVGASGTTINLVQGGVSLFTRDIPVGGDACTLVLQRELGLPFSEAEQLKRGVSAGAWQPADTAPVIRAAADTLALEVGKTLELAEAGAGAAGAERGRQIDRIVLTGGGMRTDGFETALGAKAGAVVERLNPFRRLVLTGRAAADPALADELTASGGVAIGLALRRPVDV